MNFLGITFTDAASVYIIECQDRYWMVSYSNYSYDYHKIRSSREGVSSYVYRCVHVVFCFSFDWNTQRSFLLICFIFHTFNLPKLRSNTQKPPLIAASKPLKNWMHYDLKIIFSCCSQLVASRKFYKQRGIRHPNNLLCTPSQHHRCQGVSCFSCNIHPNIFMYFQMSLANSSTFSSHLDSQHLFMFSRT